MTKHLDLPYPPLKEIDADAPLDWQHFRQACGGRLREGISLCVRPPRGPAKRGGYFFHVKETDSGFAFSTFERPDILLVETGEECVEFINHVCGLRYSERAWRWAQEVNARKGQGE